MAHDSDVLIQRPAPARPEPLRLDPPPHGPLDNSTSVAMTRASFRRRIILEADDLGLVYAFNEGIRQAYQEGVLTSTCLRANGYAYDHAIQEVLPACPSLGVGIHLCLNEAEAVAPRSHVLPLLNPRGSLRSGYNWLISLARTSEGKRAVERELRAQIEKVLASGVRVDHLNSHQHVHMIPAIFRMACRLAREYRIPAVRLTRELPYTAGTILQRCQPLTNSNIAKHVLLNYFALLNEMSARRYGIATVDYFIGVSYTARMTWSTIRDGLRAVPWGSVEVLLHPAIEPDPRDTRYPTRELELYMRSPARQTELETLRSPALRAFLKEEGWMAMSYGGWTDDKQQRQPAESRPQIPPEVHSICQDVQVPAPLWVSEAQPDSRAFAELVITQAAPEERVLDVGTGTGIIAISLLKAGRSVVGVDLSRAAVHTAKANAQRNGVALEAYPSDLLSRVEGRFDLIAFNPPYNFCRDTFVMNVAKNVLRRVPWVRRQSGLAMPRTILRFHQQLIERLVRTAADHLTPRGRLLIHAYEAEVSALIDALPIRARVELLRHPALEGHTVGLLITPVSNDASNETAAPRAS